MKEEVDNFKRMVKFIEEIYDVFLGELKKESDRFKNMVNRLRFEVEEFFFVWSEKEIEFVKCIKKVEVEKNLV